MWFSSPKKIHRCEGSLCGCDYALWRHDYQDHSGEFFPKSELWYWDSPNCMVCRMEFYKPYDPSMVYLPWGSKDHWIDSLLEKTSILVASYFINNSRAKPMHKKDPASQSVCHFSWQPLEPTMITFSKARSLAPKGTRWWWKPCWMQASQTKIRWKTHTWSFASTCTRSSKHPVGQKKKCNQDGTTVVALDGCIDWWRENQRR